MTQVVRMSITPTFHTDLENECNVRLAAGFRLSTVFQLTAGEVVLVFQK